MTSTGQIGGPNFTQFSKEDPSSSYMKYFWFNKPLTTSITEGSNYTDQILITADGILANCLMLIVPPETIWQWYLI